jgi:signal transduction histidine kinase
MRMGHIDTNECINTVACNAERLLCLVSDVLDMAQIETGEVTVVRNPCLIHNVIDSVMEGLRPAAVCKHLKFTCNFAPGVPFGITTDGSRLHQILSNVIGNAIKFTARGRVTVDVTMTEDNTDTSRIHFRIADTGNGLTSQQLGSLFVPFSQVCCILS